MLIVSNWKAYVETLIKAKKLYAVAKHLSARGVHEIVLAPPAPYIGALAPGNRSNVQFAGQDVSATPGGAETGEVTASILRGLGVSYVIVGHSERRVAGDTDHVVLEKVRHALAHGLTPILCVGERTRDADATYLTFLRTQIANVFAALPPKERAHIVIAYEPVWAIGHSAVDAIGPADLTEMVLYIRKVLSEYLPGKTSQKARVLYGGSVEEGNARDLAEGTGIDGFLIGHASTDPVSFTKIVKAIS